MEYLIICLASSVTSTLTLFSGFGLGTFLLPAFALFFPVDVGPWVSPPPFTSSTTLLMIFFALFELIPTFEKISFDKRYLPFGGLLSGFFGGLSGHQGALRSAFLGVFPGSRMVKKVTMRSIQVLVAFMLIGIALVLGSGLI